MQAVTWIFAYIKQDMVLGIQLWLAGFAIIGLVRILVEQGAQQGFTRVLHLQVVLPDWDMVLGSSVKWLESIPQVDRDYYLNPPDGSSSTGSKDAGTDSTKGGSGQPAPTTKAS